MFTGAFELHRNGAAFTRRLALLAAAAAISLSAAQAQDYKWPDNIPPEAKAMMEPMPLSPRGQAVVGFPDGPEAASPDDISLTAEDIQKLKDGNFTAAIAMNVMDAALAAAPGRGHQGRP